MAQRLELFMSIKGTSVRCPAIGGRVTTSESCVNKIHHCDAFVEIVPGRRGKTFVVCKYNERSGRRLVFGRGKSTTTPTEVMIKEGEDRKFLRELLESDSEKIQKAKKAMEEHNRSAKEKRR